jgi:hypothetical protein
VFLADNITLCHHCYGVLDENLTLVNPSVPPSPQIALPECEPGGEPEAMQPPVGKIPAKTATETPLKMARKSHQIAPDEGKMGRLTNSLVLLGKLIIGALKAS